MTNHHAINVMNALSPEKRQDDVLPCIVFLSLDWACVVEQSF
jgi:hypothetical protein